LIIFGQVKLKNYFYQKNYTILNCLTSKKKIMNYSTLKKTVALSLATAFAIAANAQDSTMTTTSSSAKTFGGMGQFRTWTVGINGGATFPALIIGGRNDFGQGFKNVGDYSPMLYYGISVRKQIAHNFGIQANINRGQVQAYNKKVVNYYNFDGTGPKAYSTAVTDVQYDVNVSGVLNLFNFDFLKRKSAAKVYVTAGYGLLAYNAVDYTSYKSGSGSVVANNFFGQHGKDHNKDYVKEMYIPVGVGAKFRLSNIIALDLGYDMKFIDGDNFDGIYRNGNNDKFSYVHAGLEFALGSTSKPDLNWANPVAMMYDELKDPTLRQEVEALKGRVTNVEQSVADLKKDTDGDGVADQFDKCPNTPAGAKVDGSGCPIDTDGDGVPDYKDACPLEKGTVELNGCPDSNSMLGKTAAGVDNIQFEFNSSVLKTDSYPTLDKLSSELREKSSSKLNLAGFASAEGTAEYNMQLSIDRANSVKTYLVNSGVDAKKISVKGYGETRPIASNDTEEGRIKNRRVEFRK
jgi:OOP family OmpA-OmpF porin